MINTAWPLAAVETERRRLEVLRYLNGHANYEAAALTLRDYCRTIGVPTNDDQMAACLSWLEEHELVTLRAFNAEPIARLTTAGRDVAQGYRQHPGVTQPEP